MNSSKCLDVMNRNTETDRRTCDADSASCHVDDISAVVETTLDMTTMANTSETSIAAKIDAAETVFSNADVNVPSESAQFTSFSSQKSCVSRLSPTANGTQISKLVLKPEPDAQIHTMRDQIHSQQMATSLNQTLEKFCLENIYFCQFAHISGQLSINVDDRETVSLPVDKTARHQFEKCATSIPSENIQSVPVVCLPKKRGRPRKNEPRKHEGTPHNRQETAVRDDLQVHPHSVQGATATGKSETTKKDPDYDEQSSCVDDPQTMSDYAANAKTLLDTTTFSHVANLSKEESSDLNADRPSRELPVTKDIEPDRLSPSPTCINNKDFVCEDATDIDQSDEEPGLIETMKSLLLPEQKTSNKDVKRKDRLKATKTPKTHMLPKTHKSSEGRIRCEKCGKRFHSQLHKTEHSLACKSSVRYWNYQCVEKDCQSLQFCTLGAVRKHFLVTHGKRPKHLHRCRICKHEFITRSRLKEHMDTFHKDALQCLLCDKSFSDNVSLHKHTNTDHGSSTSLDCSECGKVYSDRKSLQHHMWRHACKNRGKVKCDECDKELSYESLYFHKRAVHRGVKPYECKECGTSFSFHHSLKMHMLKHSGQRPFSCQLCPKTYLTSAHLRMHVENTHSPVKSHICSVCNKQFSSANGLKVHLAIHTDERPFKCTKCPKAYTTAGGLKMHEITHIETRDFKCEVCGRCYKALSALKTHQRLHSDEATRYMCDICGNRFMYKTALKSHYLTHSDERNYKCDVCSKAFRQAASLHTHMVSHSESNIAQCDICGKQFKSKQRLRAHKVYHSADKPYVCTDCGSAFPNAGGLSKHRKTVHAQHPRFACPVCGKQCNRSDNLRVHMKVHDDPELMKLSNEQLQIKADSVSLENTIKPRKRRSAGKPDTSFASPDDETASAGFWPDGSENMESRDIQSRIYSSNVITITSSQMATMQGQGPPDQCQFYSPAFVLKTPSALQSQSSGMTSWDNTGGLL